MKALILAAGRGKRIQEVIQGHNKCITKYNNKILLRNSIEKIISTGFITECVIVVGYKAKEVIDALGFEINGIKIVYCYQEILNGIIGAMETALLQIEDEDVMMQLGDELFIKPRYDIGIKKFYEEGLDCLVGAVKVNDKELIKNNYSFLYNELGYLNAVEEKPKKPYNSYLGTGNVFFRKELLSLLKNVKEDETRGERELVGFFREIIEKKKKISFYEVSDEYINLNSKNDYDRLNIIKKIDN